MIRFFILILCLLGVAHAEVFTAVEPFEKIPADKTVVWSPLFQATWDAMNEEVGGKLIKVEPKNELMARLDEFVWDARKTMPEGAWKVWSGRQTNAFVSGVNKQAAVMTGEESELFSILEERPESIACFGLLDREVEFNTPFFKSRKEPLQFGKGEAKVNYFGVKGELSETYGQDVKVLAFRPVDGSHALEVSCKEGDDKVIFYMPPEPQDFATACKWLRKWREDYSTSAASPDTWEDRNLHQGDTVKVPYVSLEAEGDLAGRLQGSRFYGISGDPWRISRAEQITKFELHEKGARVRLETTLSTEPFAMAPPKPVPRNFIYDKPFFVFLWREGAEWPYLGVWVGDDSALVDF
ncbi:MAG: hypothetical protein NWT08_11085 [Akkermansiaceae bacterium]|jgi:hypothetical protein|nr:hypothetical protein [Akkermansiaceae bacterium]MDP4646002.1 hypothetical protein [Akkermansiaceae bacterium]MDP4721870.1 hypothetical protein [Akkermansiaceae bacterium]MDP4780122.1 hypothetical protein [Akkermansiaceae bacterium]MDP4848577.1 hypothetical protein [Akkermansiaceae bacterium]